MNNFKVDMILLSSLILLNILPCKCEIFGNENAENHPLMRFIRGGVGLAEKGMMMGLGGKRGMIGERGMMMGLGKRSRPWSWSPDNGEVFDGYYVNNY